MNSDQKEHMVTNVNDFIEKYQNKYTNGQKEHGGDMWTMGAYQLINNAEDEVLDMWSYIRGIRQCLDEIREQIHRSVAIEDPGAETLKIIDILDRVKND